jgi:ammonium transporter, Amt family
VTPPAGATIVPLLILLAPFALAGLALINCGLGRSRSAAHSLMASLTVTAVAAIAYVVCGFAWQGFAGQPAYGVRIAGKLWNWIGSGHWFFSGLDFERSPAAMAASFGIFPAALTALIPLGAGGERWRLPAVAASAAVLAGWTFPVFAHWAWGGGWLAQLGASYGLGAGFFDAGGSGTIHVVGGVSALSVCWTLGPRRGKYSSGHPAAIPGHNSVFVLFGCFLALIGWMGMNAAGAILFTGAEPGRLGIVAVNTVLAAGSALIGGALVTRTRFSKPDATLTANGWVAGLVASSAGAPYLAPAAALIVGLAAGFLIPLSIEWFEVHLGIDDPGGAICVHGIGGLWGLLAAGWLARIPGELPGQWLAQLAGIAALVGFVFPFVYAATWILNRVIPFRIAPDGERQGLDLHELGANAYPELTGYLDDFTPR